MSAEAAFLSMERASFAHLGCWQNSLSCVCSIKISISCLAMVRVISFLMRSPYSLAFSLFLYIQSQQCWFSLPHLCSCLSLSSSSFLKSVKKFPTFLRTRGWIGVHQMVQDILPSPPIQVLTRPTLLGFQRSHEIGVHSGWFGLRLFPNLKIHSLNRI